MLLCELIEHCCSVLFAAGVDEVASDVFVERTRLYDSLVEYFPDSMTQPRNNLTDMVTLHWRGTGCDDGLFPVPSLIPAYVLLD